MTISQAVILAGGRGERMRPLTDTVPKPMVPFHGRPFLQYLIEHLVTHGIRRVTLLLGYLPEVTRDYFGTGDRFGLRIDYAVTPAAFETGARLNAAASLLDPQFLLMYCDNYWPMDWRRMVDRFDARGAAAQVTVYRNRDGYTRSNIRVGADGWVEVYDKSRTAANLQGVDIGFVLVRRDEVMPLLSRDDNVSFEGDVYPRLVATRRLGAFETDHRYYSVGSMARLSATERFLRFDPAVVLDRDGVLNVRPRRAEYVTKWEQFQWLPGAREALRFLKERGMRVLIMTNQPGIARGQMTMDDLAVIHGRMLNEAREGGGEISGIYFCPHGWDDGCGCRKPAPGMLFQMQREHALDLTRTVVFGDDERDGLAAAAAGAPFRMVTEDQSLFDLVRLEYGTVRAPESAPRGL